ncbi:bifunctional DNA primase/polymerase [Microbacterium sp. KKR3/1]|uniref:bifunctional DNA primase/polymerase n=1 Tax=Microbacterium sp. KKR3/1 TaxID=2904241 RepID=UPI001E3BC3A1|nr:bifunctional DNA primase/polymerase [Microbacterium sp. KKR3/1]MCE0507951.1 bifunctional DNA primase/polymerase [Microbacterium sp. KKR3/1]
MSEFRYLPLRPGTNVPWLSGWPKLATSDPAILDAWQSEFPGCNWGLLTGNGVGVLDLDTKSDREGYGGFASMITLEDLIGVDLSNLPMVETYTGAHFYFRYHGHLPTRVPWVPHLDVKADPVSSGGQGHQVALPGTVRDGEWGERTYTLVRGSLDAIPYAPESLITSIRSWRVSGAGGGSFGGGSAVDLPATDYLRQHGFRLGQRDNGFNTLAWKLTRAHYPHMDLVRQIAYEVWEHTDNPDNDPLPWSKVQYQIDRAEREIGPNAQAQLAWAKRGNTP